MIRLKTKWFQKWASKNSLTDSILLDALEDLANNLNTINLGGGLFKVRTRKRGRGKSGGYRTLVAYRKNDLAIFIYGFSKSERENLESDELKNFKKLAKDLLRLDKNDYKRQVRLGHFFTIEE